MILKRTVGTHQVQIAKNHAPEGLDVFRSQYTKFVDGSFLHGISNRYNIILGKRENRTARLFKGSSDFTGKSILQHDFVFDTLFHFINQNLSLLVCAKLAVLYHILIRIFPGHIRCDKEADKLLQCHVFMPILNKIVLEICQRQSRANFIAILLNSGTQTKTPGAGIKEACTMGSILHIIRECQRFLIIVKPRSKHLRQACADFCCAS